MGEYVKIKVQANKSGILVHLDGDFIINSVKELKISLFENLEENPDIEINLSKVKRIDTAGFQLLSLLKIEAEKNNKRVRIVKPSDDVNRIFRLYGEEIF